MDKQLFTEYPERDERKYYDLTIEKAKFHMDNLYKDKDWATRDTHVKTHAGVKATLEIFDIDEEAIKRELSKSASLTSAQLNAISIRQGLLAKPQQYPVWLRFANGRSIIANDYVSDTRSMTIKAIGVEGARLAQSHESRTQDIVVHNSDFFFIKTIREYYYFFSTVVESSQAAFKWLLRHPREFLALNKMTKSFPKSLLSERYWSGSAYALGVAPSNLDASQLGLAPVTYPAVVKYAFTPVAAKPPHTRLALQSRPGIPKFPFSDRAQALGLDSTQPDNYYRNDLIQSLSLPDAHYCWEFGIQFQTRLSMPIDDAAVSWNETQSPFFPVGRLSIKHQIIDFEKQADFVENLRFAPWNGLAVHRPVGAINRLRSVAYPVVASYRLEKRGLVYQEPTGDESF